MEKKDERFSEIEKVAEFFKMPAELLTAWLKDGLIHSEELKAEDGSPGGRWIPASELVVVAGLILFRASGQDPTLVLAEKIRNSSDPSIPIIFGAQGPRAYTSEDACAEFRRHARAQSDATAIEEGMKIQIQTERERAKAVFIQKLKQFASDLAVVSDDPQAQKALGEIFRLCGLREDGLVSRVKKAVVGK